MALKKLTQEYFDLLKSGKHSCPVNMSFIVGKVYSFKNPSNNNEIIKGMCTQNMPYALLKCEE